MNTGQIFTLVYPFIYDSWEKNGGGVEGGHTEARGHAHGQGDRREVSYPYLQGNEGATATGYKEAGL